MNGLYFQPSPNRSNDNSLPTAPNQGEDVGALIGQLINRIESAERKIEYKLDSNSLAKIILTDRDIVLKGDQVNILGQLNIVDWVRNISGNISGGIDVTSLTRITGGKVQTGIIESFNWSVGAGSQINLDTGTIVTGGSLSPKFSVSSSGVLTCQEAVVTGTLTAGSFIQGSVKLDDEFGISLADIAAGTDIQAALDAGVTNILAGVGSDFRLNVNTTDAYVTFQHKDSVFLGTAAAGSNKPGLGISSTGIAIGYNRSSDGAWVTSIALDASGNAAFLGTVTAGSIVSNSVTVDGVTLGTISSMATAGYDIQQALLVSGTSILKGVLVPTDAGALKTGTITWNSTTGALTGGTGIAITEWGIIGANAGVATFTLRASNGAATFKGDITGGSNIDITGTANFQGSTNSSGSFYCGVFNESRSVAGGVSATAGAGGLAVRGSAGTSGSIGVSGTGGTAPGSEGVRATQGSGSWALNVIGRMAIDNSTLVTNLNADRVDGYHAASLCSIVIPETGTCTISGGGFNLISNVTSQQVRGNNSNGLIIETVSDRRLKTDIHDEKYGLDFITKLKTRTFRLKSKPKIRLHGFISQEVRPLIDCEDDALFSVNDDGMYSTDYISLISPIVKAIQELNDKIRRIEK